MALQVGEALWLASFFQHFHIFHRDGWRQSFPLFVWALWVFNIFQFLVKRVILRLSMEGECSKVAVGIRKRAMQMAHGCMCRSSGPS